MRRVNVYDPEHQFFLLIPGKSQADLAMKSSSCIVSNSSRYTVIEVSFGMLFTEEQPVVAGISSRTMFVQKVCSQTGRSQ